MARTHRIDIRIDFDTLAALDKAARDAKSTRSAFVLTAIRAKLRKSRRKFESSLVPEGNSVTRTLIEVDVDVRESFGARPDVAFMRAVARGLSDGTLDRGEPVSTWKPEPDGET